MITASLRQQQLGARFYCFVLQPLKKCIQVYKRDGINISKAWIRISVWLICSVSPVTIKTLQATRQCTENFYLYSEHTFVFVSNQIPATAVTLVFLLVFTELKGAKDPRDHHNVFRLKLDCPSQLTPTAKLLAKSQVSAPQEGKHCCCMLSSHHH